jgi:UDP-glucuronate 4-epimerase
MILVTGAAGFVGFHLCLRLAERGVAVLGIDSINDYYDPGLKYARLAELGITKAAADSCAASVSTRFPSFLFQRLILENTQGIAGLFSRHSFGTVVHLAAQAGVRYSLENPRAYIDSNIVGFLNILEGCRTGQASHLVFASSSSVYGSSRQIPFREDVPADRPVSLYAATKRSNELMAHVYSHLYGIPSTGLRFFTVYGPWGRPDMAYFKFARCIVQGKPIDLYNGGDLKRDFTYIDDVVNALERVMDRAPSAGFKGSSAPFRIYNLGNNRAEALDSLVTALEKCIGKKANRRMLPMQPGDVYVTEADISNMERDFGWRPSTPLAKGIARFVEWFKEFERSSA